MPHLVFPLKQYLDDICGRSLSTIYSQEKVDHPFDEESDWGDDLSYRNDSNQIESNANPATTNTRTLFEFDAESILGPPQEIEMMYDEFGFFKDDSNVELIMESENDPYGFNILMQQDSVEVIQNKHPKIFLTNSGDTHSMNTTNDDDEAVAPPLPPPPTPSSEEYEQSGKHRKINKMAIMMALLALIGLIAVTTAVSLSTLSHDDSIQNNVALSVGDESEQTTDSPSSQPPASPSGFSIDTSTPTLAPSHEPTHAPAIGDGSGSSYNDYPDVSTKRPTRTPTRTPTLTPTRMPITEESNGDSDTYNSPDVSTESPTEAPMATPTPMPTTGGCKDVFTVNGSCYISGEETITMEFTQCDPHVDDWIGLYMEGEGVGGKSYVFNDFVSWVWSCGSKSCNEKTYNMRLHFNGNLQEGHYRLYLIRESSDREPPYETVAYSEQFMIVEDGHC